MFILTNDGSKKKLFRVFTRIRLELDKLLNLMRISNLERQGLKSATKVFLVVARKILWLSLKEDTQLHFSMCLIAN